MRALALSLAVLATPALAELRFVDRSGQIEPPHVYTGGWEHFVGGGVALFDCDGDHLPEVVAAGGADPVTLLRNRTAAPGGAIALERGAFPQVRDATGLWPLDIDGDGWQDLAVLRVGENLILRGGPDCAFTTADWGFQGGNAWSTAFSATWEPGQIRPTLAIGNYVDRSDPTGPFGACDVNELHRPEGDRYTATLPLTPGFCALSMLISDWQRSGVAELRVSNDRHYYVRDGREQMWRLDPLEERGHEDGFAQVSIWGMGIASRDITGEGRPEVMLTSMGDQLLMLNDAAGLAPAPFELGTTAHRPHAGGDGRPSTGWHAEWADVDNDGRADLFIAKGNVDQMPGNAMEDPNSLLQQTEDRQFREVSVAAGVASMVRSRGAGLMDLNADGRLDLVVVNRRAPLEVWENRSTGTGAWLALDPAQPGPNRNAVGALVEVATGQGVQVQERTVGGGHGGGQAGPLHFGLGAAAEARVRVVWPDGAESDWIDVRANRAVALIRRPGRAAVTVAPR